MYVADETRRVTIGILQDGDVFESSNDLVVFELNAEHYANGKVKFCLP